MNARKSLLVTIVFACTLPQPVHAGWWDDTSEWVARGLLVGGGLLGAGLAGYIWQWYKKNQELLRWKNTTIDGAIYLFKNENKTLSEDELKSRLELLKCNKDNTDEAKHRTKSKLTFLKQAIEIGYINLVKVLLEQNYFRGLERLCAPLQLYLPLGYKFYVVGVDSPTAAEASEDDLTVFHVAFLQRMKLLYGNSASNQQVKEKAQTALEANKTIIDLLLEENAKREKNEKEVALNAWHYAFSSDFPNPNEKFANRPVDIPELGALHYAVILVLYDVVVTMLDQGAGVDGEIAASPLYRAAKVGNFKMVKLLVERGANVDGRSKDYRPLDAALEGGHSEVENYLRHNGATSSERKKQKKSKELPARPATQLSIAQAISDSKNFLITELKSEDFKAGLKQLLAIKNPDNATVHEILGISEQDMHDKKNVIKAYKRQSIKAHSDKVKPFLKDYATAVMQFLNAIKGFYDNVQ